MSDLSYVSATTTLASSTAAASTSSSSTSTSSISEDKETFLKLLITQLENQDPLNPVDTTEFTSQLVSYSSLEQQMTSNEKLDTIISALNSSSSLSAFSYIGSDVEVDSNISAMQSGTAEWNFALEDDANTVTVAVSDEDGNVLYTKTLSETSAGTYDFSLDNTGDAVNVDEGTPLYLSVTATDSEGDNINTSISSSVTVSAVESGDGEITLYAGDYSFSSDDITALRQSSTNA